MELKDAIIEPCSTHFPPVMFDKAGNIIIAISKSQSYRTECNLDNIFDSQQMLRHETTQNFALYTEKEMQEYKYMVHFGRVTEGVLSALTEQYCSKGNCGNFQNREFEKRFDLNRLKSAAEAYFDVTEKIE